MELDRTYILCMFVGGECLDGARWHVYIVYVCRWRMS